MALGLIVKPSDCIQINASVILKYIREGSLCTINKEARYLHRYSSIDEQLEFQKTFPFILTCKLLLDKGVFCAFALICRYFALMKAYILKNC